MLAAARRLSGAVRYSSGALFEGTGANGSQTPNRSVLQGETLPERGPPELPAPGAGIESGAECDRLAPLLSAFVDGEATARELALLRPHLRGCLSCRATVRQYRATPARVAPSCPRPRWSAPEATAPSWPPARLDGLLQWLHETSALVAMRVHGVVELATAPKVAAVAASTAAIAGSGAATVHTVAREASPAPRASANPIELFEPARR